MDYYKSENSKKKRVPAWLIVVPVFLVCLFLLWYFLWFDHLATNITVTGNDYYSEEELVKKILPGLFDKNTLYLSKSFDAEKVDIPFIEEVELTVMDKHTVSIRVYEKAFAGCVRYLGNYMYFDKDGTVIESSSYLRDSVPLINGLSFSSIALNEPLPVGNENVFETILKLTQAMNKYDCMADELTFHSDGSVSLNYEGITVEIGDAVDLDRKFLYMLEMLPQLDGKSGTLDMQNFTEEGDRVIFIPD